MCRKSRMMSECVHQAHLGMEANNKAHHGAVVAVNGTVLGAGFNHNQRTFALGRQLTSLHAEVSALLSSSLRQCELPGQQSKVV